MDRYMDVTEVEEMEPSLVTAWKHGEAEAGLQNVTQVCDLAGAVGVTFTGDRHDRKRRGPGSGTLRAE